MNNFIGNISPVEKIDGDITSVKRISGNIRTKGIISGNISYRTTEEKIPKYEGDYTILPLAFQDTILPTKDKKMKEDIIVKEIPYYEVSNLSGGNTVYIAGQVEFG